MSTTHKFTPLPWFLLHEPWTHLRNSLPKTITWKSHKHPNLSKWNSWFPPSNFTIFSFSLINEWHLYWPNENSGSHAQPLLSLMTILNPLLSLASSTSKICLESILLFLFLPLLPYPSRTTEKASGLSNLQNLFTDIIYLISPNNTIR